MRGYQLTFFTLLDRRHGHKPLCDWLLDLAKESGLQGATVIAGATGFGHDGKIHSASVLDLADQPRLVVMTATAVQVKKILARLRTERLQLFYVKTAVEFALLGKPG